ncbi:hypothetical protein V6N13_060527 [Hibiscus sabdariffa]|uniref:Uncharacterized protein n=1 Tax=Hibiscus sabdariffa TaxID=183260 RepID=A0ABR2P7H2_9ROSI
MVDQGQQITQAVSVPVIGDGDDGYGNVMNVKRTVKGYIRAGFAGILLEDRQFSIQSLNCLSDLVHILRHWFYRIKEILGFNKYYEEENRYATSKYQPYGDRVRSNAYSIEGVRDDSEQRGQSPQDPVVEVKVLQMVQGILFLVSGLGR